MKTEPAHFNKKVLLSDQICLFLKWRNRWTIISLIFLLVSISAGISKSVKDEFESLGIYSKKRSWQETMLASRIQLQEYLKLEQKNLENIIAGPWYSFNYKRSGQFEKVLYISENNSRNLNHKISDSDWKLREDLTDGQVYILPKGSQITYLQRIITAEESKVVNIYLSADRGAKLWLNGKEVFAKAELGIRRKYVQKISLSLHQGKNEIQLAVVKGKSWVYGFYFSLNTDFVYRLWDKFESDFPVQWDWVNQDVGVLIKDWFSQDDSTVIIMIRKVIAALGDKESDLQQQLQKLIDTKKMPMDPAWLDLYVYACERRRESRLITLIERSPKIVFTKHQNIGGTHYAYTEAQSDAQRERNFHPGSALCLLEMDGIYGKVTTLIDDPNGMIRDPDVSLDAKKILFSWKRSDREDDFHLYEIEMKSGEVTQITDGLGFADYEGVYLPNGDIIFNSTRCVQTVDCWWTEVSNLYTCSVDGKYLRRLSFDQVHTNFPTVAPDGQVIYTRWEYNDRGQGRVQSLFQMNPDGTRQTEYYGNNSWFPNSILHARGIPGTQKVIAIAGGHHARQSGKLILIDPAKGRQENSGAQLIAPVRETKAENIDAYGQFGEQFQYPYPVTSENFLVTYEPVAWSKEWYGKTLLFGSNYYFQSVINGDMYINPPLLKFKVYFMNLDGERELLAADYNLSCNQPVSLLERNLPVIPSTVDYNKSTGTYYMHDVLKGPGLAGVPAGTIKKLRVIALEFRAAGIGENVNRGPAAGAIVSTPISVGNGS